MEPTSSSLIAAVARKSGEAAVEVAKEEAKGFITKLFGPSAEAIGEGFAIRFRERTFNNLVEVLSRAKKKLKAAGLEPKEVPLKIIHPLLEASALEDEPDLQELWANLLSASASYEAPFLPAYVDMLRHLSSEEARFLTALMDRADQRYIEWENARPEDRAGQGLDLRDVGTFEELRGAFEKANELPHTDTTHIFVDAALNNLCRLRILREPPPLSRRHYSLETFGIIFLETCLGRESPIHE